VCENCTGLISRYVVLAIHSKVASFPRFDDFTPSDVSLSLIVPLKCYVLQKHLGKLIAELTE
jgi:hypothetical protein